MEGMGMTKQKGPGRYWSAQEDANLILEWTNGSDLIQLAAKHQRTPTAIRSRLLKSFPADTIPWPSGRVLTEDDRARITDGYLAVGRHMRLKDMSFIGDLALELDCERGVIYDALKDEWLRVGDHWAILVGDVLKCACGQRWRLQDPDTPTYEEGYEVGLKVGTERAMAQMRQKETAAA